MRVSTSLLALMLAACPAMAGPLEDGIAAYNARQFDKAVQLLQPLADQGNAQAEEKIGRLHERGMGLPRDYNKAMTWYRRAAEQGDAAAEARIGFMYRAGVGVKPDLAEAVHWYERSASKGNPLAQTGMGYLTMEGLGLGVAGDPAAAAVWFAKAAEQGNASSMLALAGLIERGRGVHKDPVLALKWYLLASIDDGEYEQELFDRAKARATELSARLSPALIADAERQARQWQASRKKN